MDSTPVTRRSKRALTGTATSGKKKQKTSTPSRSRIEHYMSVGNISNVAGSPIQHTRSALLSMNDIPDSSGGEERTQPGQRGDGDQNRKGKRNTPGPKHDATIRKSNKASEQSRDNGSGKLSSVGTRSTQRRSKKQNSKSSQMKANLSTTLQNATIDKYMSRDLSSSAVSTPSRFPRLSGNSSQSENEEVERTKKRKTASKHRSQEKDDESSEEGPSTSTGTKHPKQNGAHSNHFLASGNIQSHMEDKEFLASQVVTLSKPFIMEDGPNQWIQTWKAHQTQNDDEEMEDIPEKVIHKVVTKVNYAMSCDFGLRLSRPQQRKVLINLDEIRKDEKPNGTETKQEDMLEMDASLQRILDYYPSEWPGVEDNSSDDDDDEMEIAQRYKDVHKRLSALNESLTEKEEKKNRLQTMCSQLKEIDENLKRCTDSDFKKELDRTKSLVSQILKKLRQRRSPRKHATSTDHTATSKSAYQYQPMAHEDIVRHLFASTF